jgi:hypothetical protein
MDRSTNLYIAGSFSGTVDFNPVGPVHTNLTANGQDAFLCKYDKDGNFLWVRTWGSNGQDRAGTLAVDGSNNVYVIGVFNGTVDFHALGPQTNHTAAGQDAYLCKFDEGGTCHWVRTWGGSLGEDGYCVALDSAGFVYCAGDFSSTTFDFNPLGPEHDWHTNAFPVGGYSFDCWLCKWSPDGDFQWGKTWGGNGYDDCCTVTVDGLGNVFAGGFLGSTSNTCDFNTNTNLLHTARILNANPPGGSVTDVFLSKFDTHGVWQWAIAWGSTNYEGTPLLCADGQGSVYASGYFGLDLIHPNNTALHDTVDFNPSGVASNLTSNGAGDAYLCKYDSGGALKWAKTFGGDCDEQPCLVIVDRLGCVYLSGVFKSMPCDFDPGPGVSNLWSHGANANDIFFSKFNANGDFILARSCGGTGADWGYSVDVDELGNAYLAGSFSGTVDFGPLCGGPSTNSNGGSDAFFCSIPTCYQLTVVKSGNGTSSLGPLSPAVQIVSLGVVTQVVYSAADWHRIAAFASNTVAVSAAVGSRTYTQILVNAAVDISNEVSFALATPEQTGYTNVPTLWLTHWAENDVISDPAFDVYTKYLLGLDPTTSNTFSMAIESFSVSDSHATTVLKRMFTGGLSPDGMHGQLALQESEDLDAGFTNMPGTAATGTNVFDGNNRRAYTNTIDGWRGFIRASIE